VSASALAQDLEAIIAGLGFSLLEASTSTVHGRTHVHVVIYRAEGVRMDDCVEVHKTIMPRLEVMLDDRDVALQVASPGIDRVMKDPSELRVFVNKGVQILRADNEWVAGVVSAADNDAVTIRKGTEETTVPLSEIRKAKLDYTQEVVKTDVK
jgi:ribosome maturation factor RimP